MSAFKHLSHEFLVVAGPRGDFHFGGAAEYIVDPRFREQFDIPQVSINWAPPPLERFWKLLSVACCSSAKKMQSAPGLTAQVLHRSAAPSFPGQRL